MQKLKGISSGQNNKSCRILHNGYKKNGLAFFWFFFDFLRNLQESAKLLHYWSYPFARRTLERLLRLQYGPWGAVAGAAGQNSGGSPWVLAGEGLWRVLRSG
jgi:hypothetical protein